MCLTGGVLFKQCPLIKGSIDVHIRSVCIICAGIVVDQNQSLRFAMDIARGMEFLHSMEPIVPNFLLTSKHIMVRNIFFLCTLLSCLNTMLGMLMTLRTKVSVRQGESSSHDHEETHEKIPGKCLQ